MYYYVYILQAENYPENHYTGFTTDLKSRLEKHNNGEVPHTSKYKPWRIATVIAFTDKVKYIPLKNI